MNNAATHAGNTERHVRMAAKLYQMRDYARTVLGDRFKPHMAELGVVLQRLATRDGKTVLQAAIEAANHRELIGVDIVMVMAAAVELAEPTP